MGPELLIPLLGSVIGGLGGLFGGSGDKNDKLLEIIDKIQSMVPELSKGVFGSEQLLNYAQQARKGMATAGDVAAAGIAPSVSERNLAAGVPEGQPSTSMYVSEVAPVKAKGIMAGQQTFLDFLSQIEQLDAERKATALKALGMSLAGTQGMSDTNDFGRALGGALQGGNLGFSLLGNLGKYEYYSNKKDINVG